MKILPGIDHLFNDIEARGDKMQQTLDEIKELLVKIESNTASVEMSYGGNAHLYGK